MSQVLMLMWVLLYSVVCTYIHGVLVMVYYSTVIR